MSDVALAALFAVLVWWLSTGLVLLLDRLPHGALRWSRWLSSLLALAALAALTQTSRQLSVANAYCAFSCALLVWGWHEFGFLSGWVTGPRKTALPAGVRGWPRLVQAIRAILWHELAIIATGATVVALTWGAPNQVGTHTFLVLWVMRTSAKINLYFGVRNLSEEFLPAHLAYLPSFFRRRRMNAFFPWSVAAACGVLVLLGMQAADPAAVSAQVVGSTLVGSLLALAIVEHAMLVMPFPSTALWRWALRGQAAESRP